MVNYSLYFSVYAEGPGNDQYIQIFNPSNDDVSLTGFAIVNQVNGLTVYYDPFPQGAYVPKHGSYTIAHTSSSVSISSAADWVSEVPYFNGNDALLLVTGTSFNYTVIDTIGEIGPNPGVGWNVAGVTNATRDMVLIRKPNVSDGSNLWSQSSGTTEEDSEWKVVQLLTIFPNFVGSVINHVTYWLELGQTVVVEPDAVIGGDPYIVTPNGFLYKMNNASSSIRLFQGLFNGELFTVNAELKRDCLSKERNMNEYMLQNGVAPPALRKVVKNQSFITKVGIHYLNDFVLVDFENDSISTSRLNKLTVIPVSNDISSLPMYNYEMVIHSVKICLDGLTVTCKKFSNLQIRSEVTISGTSKLLNCTGCMAMSIPIKSCKIKSLKSVKQIVKCKEKKPMKILEEDYYNASDSKNTFKIPTFE